MPLTMHQRSVSAKAEHRRRCATVIHHSPMRAASYASALFSPIRRKKVRSITQRMSFIASKSWLRRILLTFTATKKGNKKLIFRRLREKFKPSSFEIIFWVSSFSFRESGKYWLFSVRRFSLGKRFNRTEKSYFYSLTSCECD